MKNNMSNSGLVCYTKLSPNHSGQRTHGIDRITPHCVVGQMSCETICACFPDGRGASCNYGIGTDGRISLCVEEGNRSWCSSSSANDQRAVTIECASDKSEPYAMNDFVYESLVNLCTDICKRNGKNKLIWFGDKDKTLAYKSQSNEMVITVHRWFAKKSCPGDWLYNRLGDLAARVTANLSDGSSSSGDLYRTQAGAFSVKGNADNQLERVKAAGLDAFITTQEGQAVSAEAPKKSADDIAKEIFQGVGNWGRGQTRRDKLEAAGYNPDEVQTKVNAMF